MDEFESDYFYTMSGFEVYECDSVGKRLTNSEFEPEFFIDRAHAVVEARLLAREHSPRQFCVGKSYRQYG